MQSEERPEGVIQSDEIYHIKRNYSQEGEVKVSTDTVNKTLDF
jgi:hypothetical protein